VCVRAGVSDTMGSGVLRNKSRRILAGTVLGVRERVGLAVCVRMGVSDAMGSRVLRNKSAQILLHEGRLFKEVSSKHKDK
jgi:hypothetical protein